MEGFWHYELGGLIFGGAFKWRGLFLEYYGTLPLLCTGQIEAATCPPSPWAFDTFAVLGRREFDYQSLPGGGEFELHPRFHVKSLAWRAIMGDAVLEDFRGKDRAFVANWFRGKGLNKLCAVFEVFKF